MKTNTHTLTPEMPYESGTQPRFHATAQSESSASAHDMHTVSATLAPELLHRMDAYWRAAN